MGTTNKLQPTAEACQGQLNLVLERESQPRPVRVADRTPIARKTDPSTSHRAAEQITRSGRRASMNQIILAFMRASGEALTYREIANRIDQDAVAVMRRLNDLRQLGLVEKCGERGCSTNGNVMTIWAVKR